ncbi:hypothetical protein C2134_12815 [Chromobacterium sinusclupearum]|uniref:Uncharacterized protein n=1 Tax=Chromobacterium sinusclupearum TaxID=2077146 RepID=A0A2K4MMN1_9NEIS|nr:hypothetical protein C2134_12815 [Chromobacterium sinusclupearum]
MRRGKDCSCQIILLMFAVYLYSIDALSELPGRKPLASPWMRVADGEVCMPPSAALPSAHYATLAMKNSGPMLSSAMGDWCIFEMISIFLRTNNQQ